jgi:hypothetical protein
VIRKEKVWKTAKIDHIIVAFVRPLHRLHRFLHAFGGRRENMLAKKEKKKGQNGSKNGTRNSICLCSLALLSFLVFLYVVLLCFCFGHGTKCVDACAKKRRNKYNQSVVFQNLPQPKMKQKTVDALKLSKNMCQPK